MCMKPIVSQNMPQMSQHPLDTHPGARIHSIAFASIIVRTFRDISHFTAQVRNRNRNPDLNLNPVLTSTFSVHRNPQTHLCTVLKLRGPKKKTKTKFSLYLCVFSILLCGVNTCTYAHTQRHAHAHSQFMGSLWV